MNLLKKYERRNLVSIKAPFLPYDSLRPIANAFLADYHSSGGMPVPIEEIVEFQFHIDIVPVPGLRRSHEVESAITNDLATIYIDEDAYKNNHRRYRYSLAHELSHRLIHADIFSTLRCKSLNELKQAITSVPQDQYSWIEKQAYDLAGLILVPESNLKLVYTKAEETALQAGIVLKNLDINELKSVCHHIGNDFGVSGDVVRKRLKYENLLT